MLPQNLKSSYKEDNISSDYIQAGLVRLDQVANGLSCVIYSLYFSGTGRDSKLSIDLQTEPFLIATTKGVCSVLVIVVL